MARALRAFRDATGDEWDHAGALILAGALEDLKVIRLDVDSYLHGLAKAAKKQSRAPQRGRRRRR